MRAGFEGHCAYAPGKEKEIRYGTKRNLVARGGGSAPSDKHWCGCPDGPRAWVKKEPNLVYWRLATNTSAHSYKLDDIAKITYTFLKPIEETFEKTGPEVTPK